MDHNHCQCQHTCLVHCAHCDVVYCKYCKREWGQPGYRFTYYPPFQWMQGTSTYPNGIQVTYTATDNDTATGGTCAHL